jgi:hypothetical protein
MHEKHGKTACHADASWGQRQEETERAGTIKAFLFSFF